MEMWLEAAVNVDEWQFVVSNREPTLFNMKPFTGYANGLKDGTVRCVTNTFYGRSRNEVKEKVRQFICKRLSRAPVMETISAEEICKFSFVRKDK